MGDPSTVEKPPALMDEDRVANVICRLDILLQRRMQAVDCLLDRRGHFS